MKVRITEADASVYDRIGFTASTVARVAVGTEVEILTVQKQDGQRWVSVALSDGQSGYMPGETPVLADGRAAPLYEVYSRTSRSKIDARADSKAKLVSGAAWFVGGVVSFAAGYACAASERPVWVVAGLITGAMPLLIRGGILLVTGLLTYLGSVSD